MSLIDDNIKIDDIQNLMKDNIHINNQVYLDTHINNKTKRKESNSNSLNTSQSSKNEKTEDINTPLLGKRIFDDIEGDLLNHKITEPSESDNEYNNLRYHLKEIFDSQKKKEEMLDHFITIFPNYSELAKRFNTDYNKGIDTTNKKELELRANYLGKNVSHGYYNKTYAQCLLKYAKKPWMKELLVAAIVDMILGVIVEGTHGLGDPALIVGSAIILILISALFLYQKESRFKQLLNELEIKQVLVKRDNKIIKIDECELLTGDILLLQKGDIINTTGVFINGQIICSDSNNEEIEFINYYEKEEFFNITAKNLIFPHLTVLEGSGEMMVIICKRKRLQKNRHINIKKNEIFLKVESIAKPLEEVALAIGIVVAIISFVKTMIQLKRENQILPLKVIHQIVNAYLLLEAVKISLLPTGLLTSVSLSIAYSVKNMINDNVLINHFNKICQIAKMNCLLINKSSIIEGLPTVMEANINGSEFSENNNNASEIFNDIMLNTSSKLYLIEGKKRVPKGNTIDNSLLQFLIDNVDEYLFEKFESDYSSINHNARISSVLYRHSNASSFIHDKGPLFQVPFSSSNNFMLSVYEDKNQSDMCICYLKGFYENIEKMCKNTKDLIYKKAIKDFKNKSYTTIVLARKSESLQNINFEYVNEHSPLFNDYTIVAVIGISHKIQDNLAECFYQLNRSRISVKMLTEESLYTSVKICEKIGLLNKDEVVESLEYEKKLDEYEILLKNPEIIDQYCPAIKGEQLYILTEGMMTNYIKDDTVIVDEKSNKDSIRLSTVSNDESLGSFVCYSIDKRNSNNLSMFSLPRASFRESTTYNLNNIDKFTNIIRQVKLVASARPMDKLELILGIRQMNPIKNIIGVSYNGIFDDLMLSNADISFSSKLTASNLEHEVADVIILNNDFSKLLLAIEHARNIFDGIKKYAQFYLIIFGSIIVYELFGSIYFRQPPLSPIHLLWITLFTSSLSVLVFVTDKPYMDLIRYKPYDGKIFTKTMFAFIIFQIVYQMGIMIPYLIIGHKILGFKSDATFDNEKFSKHVKEGLGKQTTFGFNLFWFMMIFNFLNSRIVHIRRINVFFNIFQNLAFFIVFIVIIAIQLVLVNFGNGLTKTVTLTLKQQLYSIAAGFSVVVIQFIIKLFIVCFHKPKPKVML